MASISKEYATVTTEINIWRFGEVPEPLDLNMNWSTGLPKFTQLREVLFIFLLQHNLHRLANPRSR
jgi:hypothetical protein